ncbi:MAG: FAD-dependent oxidoreductase, partial [Staphylococcus sp.]|nr:FAD-dependent oxidoreductase [Staphylococcus sp.]
MKKTIIIIGGGIAGLSSAYFLSQQGFQIKILEREKNKDIDKICTSVVNPKTLTTLSQMGLLKYLLDYDFLHIDGIKGLSYDNTEFQGFYNQTHPYLNFGYTIPRSILSKNMHHLIKDLEDVEYFNDWEVQNTISKNNFVIGVEGIDHGKSKKIFGDLIIDASGRNSVILKKNNMIESLKNHKRYAIICQYKNVDFSDNLFSIGTHYYIEPG